MKNLHLKLALIFVTIIGQNLLGHVEIKEESDWKTIRPTLISTTIQEINKLKDSSQDAKTDDSLVGKFDKLYVHIFALKNKETFPLKNELDKDFYYLFDQSDIEAIMKIIDQLTTDLQVEENFEHIQLFFYYKPKSTGGCIIS